MCHPHDIGEVPLEYLPQSVRELARVCGLDAALAIVERRGGIRLCVPVAASQEHWLARLIGYDALERLVRHYGGEEIDIPRCHRAARYIREQQILRDAETLSQAELARKYGYTERGIGKLLARHAARQQSRQQSLF